MKHWLPYFKYDISGDIWLDEHSIYDYSLASLRQQFGMILQETWFKQGTIHDNIFFGKPEASLEEVIVAAKDVNSAFLSISCLRDTIHFWKMLVSLYRSDKPSS